jgi:hypothetical protein
MSVDEERRKDAEHGVRKEDSDDPRYESKSERESLRTSYVTDNPEDHLSDWAFRLVPLIHIGFVGYAGGNPELGLFLGFTVSATIDLFLGKRSLGRRLMWKTLTMTCPIIAATARGFSAGTTALGISVPAVLREMRCRSGE